MNSDFVVPIPPSYNQNEEMMLGDVETYVKFLENSNVSTVMTTKSEFIKIQSLQYF